MKFIDKRQWLHPSAWLLLWQEEPPGQNKAPQFFHKMSAKRLLQNLLKGLLFLWEKIFKSFRYRA